MKLIVAILRPERLSAVRNALTKRELDQMTVTQVAGCGHEQGPSYIYRGSVFRDVTIPRVRVELAVEDDYADTAVRAIQQNAQTGQVGDGIIWVFPLERVVRIRSAERLDTPVNTLLAVLPECG